VYPSIIRAHNLCYSTIVLAGEAPEDAYTVETGMGTHRFVQGVPAVLPELLTELAEFRKASKRDMAAAKARGDEWAARVHNGKQLAYKVSMNSVYGFTGASKGFLPCVPIAAAVTATGRAMIQHTRELAERLVPGVSVVYGDTDSVMVRFPPAVAGTLAEVFAKAQALAADISATFKKPVELEFEKVYWPMLLFAKKRYAGEFFFEGVACGKGPPTRPSGAWRWWVSTAPRASAPRAARPWAPCTRGARGIPGGPWTSARPRRARRASRGAPRPRPWPWPCRT
jgi:DNA polymerase delta subunit 1